MHSRTTSYAVPDFLVARIAELTPPKSIEQIAREAGFSKSSMLELVLTGEIALPFDRTFSLARAVNARPADLFRLALRDWRLERLVAPIMDMVEATDFTDGELELIALLRQHRGSGELILDENVLEWIKSFPKAA